MDGLLFLPFFHNCERTEGTEFITRMLRGLANTPCSGAGAQFIYFVKKSSEVT